MVFADENVLIDSTESMEIKDNQQKLGDKNRDSR